MFWQALSAVHWNIYQHWSFSQCWAGWLEDIPLEEERNEILLIDEGELRALSKPKHHSSVEEHNVGESLLKLNT